MGERLTINWAYDFFAYESLTVGAAVKALTESIYAPSGQRCATRAILTLEDDQVRYRSDGTDPTSSEGHLLTPLDVLIVEGPQAIKNLRLTRVTGDAKIRISYQR